VSPKDGDAGGGVKGVGEAPELRDSAERDIEKEEREEREGFV